MQQIQSRVEETNTFQYLHTARTSRIITQQDRRVLVEYSKEKLNLKNNKMD